MAAESDERELWSREVPHTAREDRGNIRRCFDPSVHPELGVDGCQTLYEGFRNGVALNPLGPCLGYRAVSSNGFPTPYIYSSYSECLARMEAFAAGLDTLNLVEPSPEDGMIVLALYMKNCVEWTLSEYAVYCLGGATAPLYDTLGPDTVQFILHQTSARSVVCTRAELPQVCKAKASGDCPSFRYAILVDGVTRECVPGATEVGLSLVSFAKVEAMGAQTISTRGHKHKPPSPKDVATFCYTSGTTGPPKGALITHENIMSAGAGMDALMGDAVRFDLYDRHLSYLPLAHIFERVVASQIYVHGASVAFYRGNPLWLIEDVQACRPTIFPAAPRVLNKIYDKIMAGVSGAGGMKKRLFDAALAAKTEGLAHGHLTHALYDRLIFNKIKAALGFDCIRFMVSGSAPLSPTVMTFFRCLLGVPVVEGYGQTEGAASATIAHPDDICTSGHVGGPTGATEVVLMDVPEMGYLKTDTNHRGQPCQGRGEICIRGPIVFKGYYKNEEKTRETIDEEGWLHSGDIGLWTMQGQLQIIDRKKNLFKLSQGEYVSPEKVENALIGSALINQCFVYGDSFQNSLVAIVVPDEETVMAWAEKNAMGGTGFAALCKTDQLHHAIMEDIRGLSKKRQLLGFETVKAIHLEPEPFTADNDLITPTFKLKRQKLRDHYESIIQGLYDSMPPPKSKL